MYDLAERVCGLDPDAAAREVRRWLEHQASMAERICTLEVMAQETGVQERVVRRWIRSGLLETKRCRCTPGKPHHSCTRGALRSATIVARVRAASARLESLGRHRSFKAGEAIVYPVKVPHGGWPAFRICG
jgi:hypothetical protein